MRSIQSFLVEQLLALTKKKLNVNDYLEERRKANQLPYELPENSRISTKSLKMTRFQSIRIC